MEVRRPLSAQVDGWEAVRRAVFNRDMGCVVPTIDPTNRYPCKGYPTLAHVPERGKNALGKKAPDDEAHLVAECAYHNVDHPEGRDLREKQRQYLARWWPEFHGEGDAARRDEPDGPEHDLGDQPQDAQADAAVPRDVASVRVRPPRSAS